MLVGAPKFKTQQNLEKPGGSVFQCPLTTYIDDCEDLELDTTDNGRYLR